MGLFINKNDHPDVYNNIEKIQAPNQSFVRHNYLSELLDEQLKTNNALAESIAELKPQYEQLEEIQTSQWKDVKNQINDLRVSNLHRDSMDSMIIQRLEALDENENRLKKSIIDHMNSQNEAYQNMLTRLEKNEASFEQLTLQMNKQLDLQKEVVDTLLKQEEFQTGVLNRLDNQEALTEKISRQLNNIRSIFFERTNFIVTKLEDSYNLTSAYVYKLINKSEQPNFSTVLNNKKNKNQKQTD